MKIALCTQSLQLPQLLELQSFILNFRPAFYGKNKGKYGVFYWRVKKYHISVIFYYKLLLCYAYLCGINRL